ncbi:hypothetical protein HPB50_012678 [Hyalomma asiaticum]|uniref:Uncharacterized protein n=1 Tax=Hyalomma asiaticum TaxID=266040 RepID=A0ACB7RZU6_HYAAI|nr:hypothetical protein HPB50_012678 [Hyalomma asiaticum]
MSVRASSLLDEGCTSPLYEAVPSLYSDLLGMANTGPIIQGWFVEAVQDSVVAHEIKLRNSVPRVEEAVIVSSSLEF